MTPSPLTNSIGMLLFVVCWRTTTTELVNKINFLSTAQETPVIINKKSTKTCRKLAPFCMNTNCKKPNSECLTLTLNLKTIGLQFAFRLKLTGIGLTYWIKYPDHFLPFGLLFVYSYSNKHCPIKALQAYFTRPNSSLGIHWKLTFWYRKSFQVRIFVVHGVFVFPLYETF